MMGALRKNRIISYGFVLGLMFSLTACTARVEVFEQKGYVNDLAGVLNNKIISEITILAEEINNKADVELVIITTKNIDLPIKDFSEEIFRKWNIGGKEPGKKGILVLIDAEDKKVYIENTRALDDVVTNDKKKIIINVLMERSLKNNDFSGAVGICVVQLAKILRDGLKVDIKPVYHNIK